MYSFLWDKKTRGYKLTNQTGRFVANEIRPVFAEELSLTGLGNRFEYDRKETRPLMWAQRNTYLIAGEDEKGNSIGRKVAQLNGTQYGRPLSPEFFFTGKLKLEPVDITAMVAANAFLMDIIVADAKRRTKELYDADIERCNIAYIAFSGGKDSVALLDICHRVLPLSVPVIFSDTDMELPDTYKVWEQIQTRYPEREFIAAKAESSALENWRRFAPPSRSIRWCCSVHKSTPALMFLKEKLHKSAIKVMAFVGVRGDESISRSFYEDAADGAKNASQLNRMPILDWGAHELWLYIFANNLLINCAYRKGLPRVGCLMCPESSEKYEWFIDKAYPRWLKPYKDIIIKTSSKSLSNEAERNEFIGKRFWQARRSGAVLRETITPPLEHNTGLLVTFQSPNFKKDLFYEWIKTIGTLVRERCTGYQRLKLPQTLDRGIPFTYNAPYTGGGIVTFEFQDVAEKKKLLGLIRECLRKVSACIGCQSCEAECSFGAINIKNGRLKVDGVKCTKCHACYNIDNSCWRYRSMYEPENTNSISNTITSYRNFGLRESWVGVLLEMGERFFVWDNNHTLGKDMVKSARSWFPQAMITTDNNRKLSPLVDIFKKYGVETSLAWEFVWIALVNNSPLVKWYITANDIDKMMNTQQLLDLLKERYPLSSKAKDRRLDPLKNTFVESPLGGANGVVELVMKGKQVKSVTRKAKDVNPLTILYGLYLIAAKVGRGGFTVRELMMADENSAYISPLVAFGISPDTFKKQCEGLKSRYPDYIETTFTHGNDELTIFPSKYTTENIIMLALGD